MLRQFRGRAVTFDNRGYKTRGKSDPFLRPGLLGTCGVDQCLWRRESIVRQGVDPCFCGIRDRRGVIVRAISSPRGSRTDKRRMTGTQGRGLNGRSPGTGGARNSRIDLILFSLPRLLRIQNYNLVRPRGFLRDIVEPVEARSFALARSWRFGCRILLLRWRRTSSLCLKKERKIKKVDKCYKDMLFSPSPSLSFSRIFK